MVTACRATVRQNYRRLLVRLGLVLAVALVSGCGDASSTILPPSAGQPSGAPEAATAASTATGGMPGAATAVPASAEATPDLIAEPVGGAGTAVAKPAAAQLRQEAEQLSQQLQATPRVITDKQDCAAAARVAGICEVLNRITPVTRPEWQALLPQTSFFVVNLLSMQPGPGGSTQIGSPYSAVFARKDAAIYTQDQFRELLKANNVGITAQNQQDVMKAFVLMTLGERVTNQVTFSFGASDKTLLDGTTYSAKVDVWTKIQGLQYEYHFAIEQGVIIDAFGAMTKRGVGDYIDVPFDTLPLPTTSQLNIS